MQLKEVKIRSDERDRRPDPEERFDPLQRLVSAFDRVTQPLRDRINSKARDVQLEVNGRLNLSQHYRDALVSDLQNLRKRINAGGIDGLVASGQAMIECSRLKPT